MISFEDNLKKKNANIQILFSSYQVPVPPQDQVAPANLDFEVVEAEDCVMAPPKTDADVTIIYTKLEEDLIAQIKVCAFYLLN